MWLQEIGTWDIVPEEVMRGTIDVLDNFSFGAMRHPSIFKPSHTLCLWWNTHRLTSIKHDLLKSMTGLDCPGRGKYAALWTNNPDHRVATEDPLKLDERTIMDVLGNIHLLKQITIIRPKFKEYLYMKSVRDSILADAFEPDAPRVLGSLKEAKVYVDYMDQIC